MKTITKLSLIAATFAAIGTSAAFAGDAQLQNRLAIERQNAPLNQQSATIAVYAGRHGVSQRSAMQDNRSDLRFELRTNAQGQQFAVFAPVK
jgi:hypothetical protein